MSSRMSYFHRANFYLIFQRYPSPKFIELISPLGWEALQVSSVNQGASARLQAPFQFLFYIIIVVSLEPTLYFCPSDFEIPILPIYSYSSFEVVDFRFTIFNSLSLSVCFKSVCPAPVIYQLLQQVQDEQKNETHFPSLKGPQGIKLANQQTISIIQVHPGD